MVPQQSPAAPTLAAKAAASPSVPAAEGPASQSRRRKPKSERKKERREAEERAKAAQAIGSTHGVAAGPVAAEGEVEQPVTAEVEKTDKGKGKAKEQQSVVRRAGGAHPRVCLSDAC